MARTKKQEPVKETATVVTRAAKKDATKTLIKECLAVKPMKHNELLDEAAKLYKERFGGEETENINDVKGRIGSVLDIMKKESDVAYEGGMYALKARALPEMPVKAPEQQAVTEEKTKAAPAKKPAKKSTKKKAEIAEEVKAETTEEQPAKKAKKTTKSAKKTEPLPPAPIQPIAPVAPVTPEIAPEPIPETTEEKPAPKKRGRKPKAVTTPVAEPEKVEAPTAETPAETPVETAVETPVETPAQTPVETAVEVPMAQPIAEEKPTETGLVVKEKAPIAKKEVIDVSFFLGGKAPAKTPVKEPVKELAKEPEKTEKKAEKPAPKTEKKPEPKAEVKQEKPVQKTEVKQETKPVQKAQPHNVRKLSESALRTVKKPVQKPQTADERLREAFLRRLRSLGGDYFEYYSVYLLERYSMKNGRRLEGLRISGGEHDGGIDGEIELTDKLGFKETIYIQSKNWNPEKGDEKLWVVGETLLQQFIGACACRQAKDGRQSCRGIFITTSRFTPEAKRILDTMSDKIVGYDGNDLYDAAKECAFGLVEKNGVWSLDEKLLSGSKAFFQLY